MTIMKLLNRSINLESSSTSKTLSMERKVDSIVQGRIRHDIARIKPIRISKNK